LIAPGASPAGRPEGPRFPPSVGPWYLGSMMRAAIVLALTLAPGLALADVIPACPPGTYYVANPPEPGATRPAGGHCTNNFPPDLPTAVEEGTPPTGATGTPTLPAPTPTTDPGAPSAGAGGATDPSANPGAIVVPEPAGLVPSAPAAVTPELGAPVDPSALGARTAEGGEGAAPPAAEAPAAVPTAGLCSASVASEGALGLGALFALAALVLRRLRLA